MSPALRSGADVLLGRMRSPDNVAGEHMTPYLRAANVADGELRLDDIKAMNFTPSEQARYALEPGDVLVTEGSGSRATVGATAPWPGSPSPMMFQNTLLRLRARRHVEPRFLSWWSRHAFGSGLYAFASQGLAIWHLSAERARALPFEAPDRATQRRIADFLDGQVSRIDNAIALRQREQSLVREQRDAVIKSIVSGETHGELVPTELPWLDQLPMHWTSPKITYAARLGSGHTPSRSRPEWWVNCDIPWITTGEVGALRDDNVEEITETREKLSRLGIENSSAEIHPAGTVVLSRTASAGYSGVMAADMCTSQDFVTWTCEPRLDPYWLLWCLRAMRSDLLGRLAMGSTFKTIYVPDIQTLRIPLPPVVEQNEGVAEIRRAVEAAKHRTKLINRGIALLEERKRALITAAVTGQFDVTTARAVA